MTNFKLIYFEFFLYISIRSRRQTHLNFIQLHACYSTTYTAAYKIKSRIN